MQLESQGAAFEAKSGPVLFSAGTAATGDFSCTECGYGITVRSLLPECPMCRGLEWEELSKSPYSRRVL
jgi:lipopolysaccharide biosynthesis regulator YciM